MFQAAMTLILVCSLGGPLVAGDWATYRGDAGRTGYARETLPAKLSLQWRFQSRHAPQPAWPRDPRMLFDRAYHTVIANGTLYFGSSVDTKITALDAVTGEQKWSFFTEGPVRFAPVIWKDRVFAVSDDGYLYCLSAKDGKLHWKKRGGPSDDKVLGNGRFVSRWPARGGPVIFDDVLYFAAGIWQSEKVFLYAVNPETGKTLWKNDSSGGITMPQPHGGANAESGVSAQGYLAADADRIYVPTGRAVPAVFRRRDGKFLYYHLQANGHRGGTATTVAGRFIYNGGATFVSATGKYRSRLGVGPVAAFAGGILHHNGSRLAALKQIRKETKDRKGKPITVDDHAALWRLDKVPGGKSLIVAGNVAVSGGDKSVTLIDLKRRKVISKLPIDGIAYGLAVADGRLYVCNDEGTLSCFGPGPIGRATHIGPAVVVDETPDDSPYVQAAQEIIAKSKITDGYCVDLGCGDGSLAYQLAKRTKLRIIAIDSDPKKVAVARNRLDAAGFYGSRVTVHLGDPAKSNYPKYVANLVVSGPSITAGAANETVLKEARRVQRPYGGVMCVGKLGAMKAVTRGPLKNAGSWSHLYSNAANTLSSTDDVKGPLSMLWFRDVDLDLPQRHGRGPSPLFHDGRLFAEGLNELRAVDAYNGRTLWKLPLKGVLDAYNADHIVGASQTGSNFCAAGDSVYARQGGVCYRIAAATGKVIGTFAAPKRKDGKPARWGYLACEDGVLFGTVVNDDHIIRHAWRRADTQMKQLRNESLFLFAMDAKTGRLLWRYDAKHSIRHNAIAIGDGRVFLIDRPLAEMDRLDAAARRRGKKAPKPKHVTGNLISLDAKTGKRKWDNKKDIFGTVLAFNKEFDMLMMCYQSTRFKIPSEVGGRMAVFRGTEGYRVWDKKVRYITRPLINGRTIMAQGGAWDLLTGDDKPFTLKRSYGCGQISASKNLLLFRSATLGYLDLSKTSGTQSFGGMRPGCWINSLPAGGLVFVPDASAGCRCSYQNRAWVALQGQ
ncbi:MAG: PQQ-binding-like beta-propeller repeat protein [Planctomycetaceae bacterium]